jgi:hypothetical protein
MIRFSARIVFTVIQILFGNESAAASINSKYEFHIADRALSAAYEWAIFVA